MGRQSSNDAVMETLYVSIPVYVGWIFCLRTPIYLFGLRNTIHHSSTLNALPFTRFARRATPIDKRADQPAVLATLVFAHTSPTHLPILASASSSAVDHTSNQTMSGFGITGCHRTGFFSSAQADDHQDQARIQTPNPGVVIPFRVCRLYPEGAISAKEYLDQVIELVLD